MSTLPAIEHCLEAFEATWRRGEEPGIVEFLATAPNEALPQGVARRDLLLELVSIDLEYRWRAVAAPCEGTKSAAVDEPLGPRPTLRRYAAAIDELGAIAELPPQLIVEEYRVRRLWGDRPTRDRFLAEYPELAGRLVEPLAGVDRELRAEALDDVKLSTPVGHEHDPRLMLDWSDFVLQKHLGTGGMCRVYRAWQKSAMRTVAVKALLKSRQTDPGAVERFLQEESILARLNHPGIVRVHGVGRFPGGGCFLALDLVEGEDLARRFARQRCSTRQAIEIATAVCEALRCAHREGIVHCDLKPANVLIDASGKVTVTDFGFAQLLYCESSARQDTLGGTAAFMAPEQFGGDPATVGPAVDVYGVGGLLLTLLTGRAPNAPCESSEEGATWWSVDATWPEDTADGLRDLCRRCLQWQASRRFGDLGALLAALRAVAPLD